VFSPSTIATFALASIAILVIPGPAVLYVLNRSISDGRQVGLAAVAGVELGTMVHVFAATAGLSAVLASSAAAFNTVKWLGAAYLIGVGVRTLLRRPVALDRDRPGVSAGRAFRQGVVVNVLNPKVALFFLSFLPQFIHPDRGHPTAQAFVLGLEFVAIAFVTDGLYAIAASGFRELLVGGRSLPFVQRYVAGTVFIGLGLVAATASVGHLDASASSS
jgi:threonine/homoserine/homoserine lactone efflux protein